MSDEEMYKIYNMGAGFAVYANPEFMQPLSELATDLGLEGAWEAGCVEAGPKQVVIEPLDIVLAGITLAVR